MTALPPDDIDMAEAEAVTLYEQTSRVVNLPDPLWKIARIYASAAARLIIERDAVKLILDRDQETQELK